MDLLKLRRLTLASGILGGLLYMVLVRIIPSENNSACEASDYFYKLSLNSSIQSKYLDGKNSMHPVIEVTEEQNQMQKLDLTMEQSGLFYYLEEGDSVTKKAETLALTVRRMNKDTIFYLMFDCLR